MTTNALWRRTAVACALLVTAGACASGGGETADTASAAAEMTATTSAMRRVLIDTDAGPITVEINETAAPVTAANFMQYVTDARYDGGAFYRVVTMQNQPTSPIKIEVIQGGVDGDSTKMLPPIAHETNDKTGLKHLDGTISMARGAPGTAASEFFFCIGPQPDLDFGGMRNPDGQGFAAFGTVVEGMDVVRKIQQMPADSAPPQRLKTVVRIKSIRIL
ncbi:MAG: peptidylprolyl isomerase [Gemmatimonadetes bacterium]|nr:peptidylprolyl isomerase [Gemmatimonadota bacterium]MCC6770204.1 peptidylprolyl isomerase [Gemmatimonadaceae bacterium]